MQATVRAARSMFELGVHGTRSRSDARRTRAKPRGRVADEGKTLRGRPCRHGPIGERRRTSGAMSRNSLRLFETGHGVASSREVLYDSRAFAFFPTPPRESHTRASVKGELY